MRHLLLVPFVLGLVAGPLAGGQERTGVMVKWPDEEAEPQGWVALFDGKSLEGWTPRNGTATYRVEDGAIVGRTTDGSPNSFLCTDELYADFELEFEVKVDDALNSGVQIRSQTRGGPTGRVNGPQVEIEASGPNGAEAGYLYAEAAGGWMTTNEERRPHKHFRDGEWNHYRVRAVGPTIEVWINEEKVSALTDRERFASHPEGFIGLQVHSVGRGQGPFEVRWRNLKIQRIDTGWVRLFNGRDLSGWRTTGNWIVEPGGVLAIQPREDQTGWQRFSDYLITERKYDDFELELEYRYPEGGNSGVFVRIGDPAQPVSTGIECQILDSYGKEGPMTHHDHGGIIRTVGASKNMSKQPGEWNHMTIYCWGSGLGVRLNGETIVTVDLQDSPMSDRPLEGHIGLQDHGWPHEIRFRNIRLREPGGD